MGDEGEAGKKGRNPWALRASVIALALSVGFFTWAVTRGDDDEPAPEPASTSAQTEARIISEEELADIALTAGHPVYWAGSIPNTELEITESADGDILVRYLEDGAGIGEGTAEFLAVGSYPMPDAEKTMDEYAEQPGAVIRHAPDGRELVANEETETNVFFGSPDSSVQVEVYDPSSQRAMSLARSGQVEPVG
jgi:hypothetical protein